MILEEGPTIIESYKNPELKFDFKMRYDVKPVQSHSQVTMIIPKEIDIAEMLCLVYNKLSEGSGVRWVVR